MAGSAVANSRGGQRASRGLVGSRGFSVCVYSRRPYVSLLARPHETRRVPRAETFILYMIFVDTRERALPIRTQREVRTYMIRFLGDEQECFFFC